MSVAHKEGRKFSDCNTSEKPCMNKAEGSCTKSSSYNIFLLVNGPLLKRELALRQSDDIKENLAVQFNS
jgi:hypothetical protein